MKVDLTAFQDACEEAGGEWYGEYPGRGFFDGYGASFDSTGDLVKLGAALAEYCPELVHARPHIDSLGMGLIIAWPKRLFDEEESD